MQISQNIYQCLYQQIMQQSCIHVLRQSMLMPKVTQGMSSYSYRQNNRQHTIENSFSLNNLKTTEELNIKNHSLFLTIQKSNDIKNKDSFQYFGLTAKQKQFINLLNKGQINQISGKKIWQVAFNVETNNSYEEQVQKVRKQIHLSWNRLDLQVKRKISQIQKLINSLKTFPNNLSQVQKLNDMEIQKSHQQIKINFAHNKKQNQQKLIIIQKQEQQNKQIKKPASKKKQIVEQQQKQLLFPNKSNSKESHRQKQKPQIKQNIKNKKQQVQLSNQNIPWKPTVYQQSKNFDKSSIELLKTKYNSIFFFFQNARVSSVRLIYKASQCNFQTSYFRKLCENVTNTLVVVQTQFDKVIGGFTPLPWNSNKNGFAKDTFRRSFLFSLTDYKKYQLLPEKHSRQIYCCQNHGPAFGDHDLIIFDKANVNLTSYSKIGSTYSSTPIQKPNQQMITNFTGCRFGSTFKIKQWEVWKLQFMKPF